jgi:hypothetical protein
MDSNTPKMRTELSSRTAAIFSWLAFLGIALFLITRATLDRSHWLGCVAVFLVASGFLYKTYAAWKSGHRKAFWLRLGFLLVAVLAALSIGYFAGKKS